LPSKFVELDRYEKAFIIACIDIKIENEKKEAQKLKKKNRRR
jgi:hypothetical protein